MQRSRKAHSDDFSCFRKAWGTPYSGLSWSLSIPTPTLELGGISPEFVLSPWAITAWSKLQCKDCKKVLGVCYKKCSVFYSSCVEMRNGHYISLDESSHWWTIPKMCLCSCKGTKANGESPDPWQEMTFSTWTLHHYYGSGTCSFPGLFFHSWNSFQASFVFMHQTLVKKKHGSLLSVL